MNATSQPDAGAGDAVEVEFSVDRRGDRVVLFVSGEVDHHTAGEFRSRVDALIDEEVASELTIDFRDVSFLDSSGLGTLVGIRKTAKRAGTALVLANMAPHVSRIFTLTRMDTLFDIRTDDGARNGA